MNKALIQRLTNVDLTKCADMEAGDGGVGRKPTQAKFKKSLQEYKSELHSSGNT